MAQVEASGTAVAVPGGDRMASPGMQSKPSAEPSWISGSGIVSASIGEERHAWKLGRVRQIGNVRAGNAEEWPRRAVPSAASSA